MIDKHFHTLCTMNQITLSLQLSNTTLGNVWNTDTHSIQALELMLFATAIFMAILTLLLVILIFPNLKNYDLVTVWDALGLHFLYTIIPILEYTSSNYLVSEIEHLSSSNLASEIDVNIHSQIREKLRYVLLSVTLIGFGFGILRTKRKYCGNDFCIRPMFYAFVFFITIMSSVHSIPLVIEAFIYPTEMITTIGFIVIGVASISAAYTILSWLIRDNYFTSKSTNKSKRKCCYHLCMATVSFCVYIIVPCSVYGFLWFYLQLLQLRLESPTSQLIQTMLAFLPTIFVTFGSYLLRKKLGRNSQNEPHPQKETVETTTDDHTSEQVDNTSQYRSY